MNHDPQKHPGSAPNLSVYSDKRIAFSTQPIRDKEEEMKMKASEMEDMMKGWEDEANKHPLNHLLNS